jgi:hypothetical protein
MPESRCPEDHELMPLLEGGKVTKNVQGHLKTCAACKRRLKRLMAEVRALRRNTALPGTKD